MFFQLGAGTSLPGFLCASLSSETHVILTDRSDSSQILENIRDGAKLNGFITNSATTTSDSSNALNEVTINSNVWVRGLEWGCFDDDEEDDEYYEDQRGGERYEESDCDDLESGRQKSEKGSGGLFKLLRDIEKLGRKLDWILGSDTFYDPKGVLSIIIFFVFFVHRCFL